MQGRVSPFGVHVCPNLSSPLFPPLSQFQVFDPDCLPADKPPSSSRLLPEHRVSAL